MTISKLYECDKMKENAFTYEQCSLIYVLLINMFFILSCDTV